MSHATRAFTVLGLALVAWGLFALVSRSVQLTTAKRVIAEQKEENAAKVEAVYRLHREFRTQDSLRIVQAERALAREREKSQRVLDSATATTLTNTALLHDAQATVPQLRTALSLQIQTTQEVSDAFRAYLQSDSVTHAAWEVRETGLLHSLALADSSMRAWKVSSEAWRNASECTIVWGIRCPTRTQTAVGGIILTLGVVYAAR